MNNSILNQVSDLNKQLINVPRHLMYQFCKLHGYRSPHNAENNPNYQKFKDHRLVNL